MSLSPSTTSDAAPAAGEPTLTTGQVDASTRLPVVFLLASASCWLVLSAILGLLASIKMHMPQILAECPIFTYGRIQAASQTLFLYGFASQAALGVALWLLARLGRTKLVMPGIATIGALFWNVGVTAGLVGILIGNTTGYESLELPAYVAPILFFAYLFIGIPGVLTFKARESKELYPSQWFLLAALFWFPWIYSTAVLLLFVWPVRGVLQAVIGWWYGHNLTTGFLGFISIGSILYFLAKLTGRPLHSRQSALFGFLILLFAGAWGGIHAAAPVPRWMPGISAAMTMVSFVGVLALFINAFQTARGASVAASDSTTFTLTKFALFAFLLAGLLGAIGALRPVSLLTHFTYAAIAQQKLVLHGFIGLSLMGAAYYVLPRLIDGGELKSGLTRASVVFSIFGIIMFAGPLLVGGYIQGTKLANAGNSFPEVFRSGVTYFRVSTIGELFMVLGYFAFAVNVKWMLFRSVRTAAVPFVQGALKPQVSGGAA